MKKKSGFPDLFYQAFAALYLFFLTFIAAVQNSDSIWGNGESWLDASVYKYVAWMMDLGYMPYKDTFDHKGPLVYLIFWLGRKIAEWRGVWVLYFFLLFLSLLLIYRIFRRFCSRPVSMLLMLVVFAVLFDYEIVNMSPESMSVPFMAGGLAIFIDYFLFEKISGRRLFLSGVCFACVLLLKVQMVSVWFVFSIAVLIKNSREKRGRDTAYFLLVFLAGCAVVLLPAALWLIRGGAWAAFIDDYFIFNVKYARYYSGSTPLESSLAKAGCFLYYLNRPIVLLCLFFCVYWAFSDRKNRFFHLAYLAYLLVSIAAASMSGRNYGHYGTSLIPAVTFPLAYLLSGNVPEGSIRQEAGARGRNNALSLAVLAYLVCIFSAPVLFSKTGKALEAYGQYSSGQLALSSNLQGLLNVIYENTDENDQITVHGLYDILYGKSGRMSASRYSFQHAFASVDPEKNNEYYADLEKNLPKLIIQGDADKERMLEFISSHGYRKIAVSESGEYAVYKLFGDKEDPLPAWAKTLRRTDSFTEYLDILAKTGKEQDITVYMAVKGTAGDELSVSNARQLKELGFSAVDLLLDRNYHTFLGISQSNCSLYEAVGGNGADLYEGTVSQTEISLISAMKKRGNQASIRLDGIEYAPGQRGFNIVVYDSESHRVVDSVAFDTDVPEMTCTR